MTYDTYGNIISKNGKTYTYGDENWRDLTKIDGEEIEYDAQGTLEEFEALFEGKIERRVK